MSHRRSTPAAFVLALALAACSAPAHTGDGDTGAAAPATQQSLSPTPGMGDTNNVTPSTGAPAMAGDTLGAHGKAAGTPPAPKQP